MLEEFQAAAKMPIQTRHRSILLSVRFSVALMFLLVSSWATLFRSYAQRRKKRKRNLPPTPPIKKKKKKKKKRKKQPDPDPYPVRMCACACEKHLPQLDCQGLRLADLPTRKHTKTTIAQTPLKRPVSASRFQTTFIV